MSSMHSSSIQASRSFNNLTAQLNSSVNHNLRSQMVLDNHRGKILHEEEDKIENSSDGNESCDISAEHEGSTRRRQTNEHKAAMVEDVDADLSSLNPLVTPGVEATENRCSYFESNGSRQPGRHSSRKEDTLMEFAKYEEQAQSTVREDDVKV